jgi:hypothetical protein
VHHRCITEARLEVFCGARNDPRAAWLSQLRVTSERFAEESGFQACYRKTLRRGVFPLSITPRQALVGSRTAAARAARARSPRGATPRPGSDRRPGRYGGGGGSRRRQAEVPLPYSSQECEARKAFSTAAFGCTLQHSPSRCRGCTGGANQAAGHGDCLPVDGAGGHDGVGIEMPRRLRQGLGSPVAVHGAVTSRCSSSTIASEISISVGLMLPLWSA